MFEAKGISLNELEKKSFFSFLTLYLVSSALFISLLGYWYYNAQKNAIENEVYYKLIHLADKISGRIINAQMKSITLTLPHEEGYEYELIPTLDAKKYKEDYFEQGRYKVLISASPQEHLGIAYVIVKTQSYFNKLRNLQLLVLLVVGVVLVLVSFVSFFLARLFMKPLRSRVEQIENFIQDVSHELNTPITVLKMSASRGMKKGIYDKNIFQNISISTKQLESIYKSLTYLNFKQEMQQVELLNLKDIVEQTIRYYTQLIDAKHIKVITDLEDVKLSMVPSKAELLFSNLLSNAIKYSMPDTMITMKLTKEYFIIKDEGMGIKESKLQEIFEIYKRDSSLAGGFGVGLSIVKQICDAYDIRVEVKSELDKGSSFKLHF